MGRVLAWLMIITGTVILGFNGYKWWGEIVITVQDPKVAMTIADNWQETKTEPSLTSVDNLAIADEEFNPGFDITTDENKKQNTTETKNQKKATDQDQQTTSPKTTKTSNQKQNLQVGSNIGNLVIPKIGVYQPIVEGTDEKSLKKGVGKYRGWGTVAPNQTGHVVLSGHRNTVLPKNIGQLTNGDKIYVKFKNKIYTYQIRKTWITHADDRTVIVPIPQPVLTLTTCYPFDYKGDAPDRYIIRADLIRIQNNA